MTYGPNTKKVKELLAEIPKVPFFKQVGPPKKAWRVFTAPTLDAARDAARGAARGAAWDAAWGAARGAARGAAWDATWGAAWDATWGAAWDATWGAARGAARDFALAAQLLVVADLEYPGKAKHQKHVKERLEVWRRGWGLLCDVDGVLYVYGLEDEGK